MSWELTRIERMLSEALTHEFGEAEGATRFGNYTSARQILIDDVYEEIRGEAPGLTDHGPKHIRNVLDNAGRLVEMQSDYFRPLELYVLALGILFHDVGNLEGRTNHNQRISKYYDWARPDHKAKWAHEKQLVIAASRAHTGTSTDGSRDTLKEIADDQSLDGHPIRLQKIAAVIRFADELAEGIQRTSLFLQSLGKYGIDEQIHHRYAQVTDVLIDPGNRRIALTYQIILDDLGKSDKQRLSALKDLLGYIYVRVAKLDEERKYARFYCGELLVPFRETSIQIHIHVDGNPQDLGLPRFSLDDKVVPGSEPDLLPSIEATFKPKSIVAKLKKLIKAQRGRGDG